MSISAVLLAPDWMPGAVFGFVVLVNLLIWPGLLTMLLTNRESHERLSPMLLLVGSISTSVIYVGLLSFLLGYLRVFSLWNLTLLVAILSMVLLAFNLHIRNWRIPSLTLPRVGNRSLGAVGLFLVALVALTLWAGPSENILLNWDDGTYVNTAANVVSQGSILHTEPAIDLVPESLRRMFFDTRPGPISPSQFKDYGFWINWERGDVTPQYFHLYPTILAVFISLLGLPLALYLNSLLAILSVGTIYLLGQTIANSRVGFLAAALLALSFPQFWFAGFPSAEILFQLLVLNGILMLVLLLRTQQPLFGLVAGLSLGSTLLARPDGLLLVPAVAVTLLLLGRQLTDRSRLAFGLTYLISYGLSIVYLTDLGYKHLELQLVSLGIGLSQTQVVLLLTPPTFIIAWLTLHPPRMPELSQKKKRSIVILVTAVPGLTIVALLLATPFVIPGTFGWNLIAMSFYITPLALIVGLAGLLLMAQRTIRHPSILPVLALTLPFFLMYIPSGYNQLFFPWYLRRWIQVIIPTLFLGGAFSIGWISETVLKRRGRSFANFTAVVLGLALILPSLALVAPYAPVIENRGLVGETETLASKFGQPSVILFYSRSGGFGLPLSYIHGLQVVELQFDPFSVGEDEGFLRVLDEWMSQGLAVYLINPSTSFLQDLLKTHPANLSWSQVIEVPQYRMSHAGHDFDIVIRTYPLYVYTIGPRISPVVSVMEASGVDT